MDRLHFVPLSEKAKHALQAVAALAVLSLPALACDTGEGGQKRAVVNPRTETTKTVFKCTVDADPNDNISAVGISVDVAAPSAEGTVLMGKGDYPSRGSLTNSSTKLVPGCSAGEYTEVRQ